MNYYAWAVSRALEFAAATALVALLVASTVSGAGAERLASVAYVAAIVAALLLVLKWFLPAAAPEEPRRALRFPAIFTFSLAVALLVMGAAAFAAQPATAVPAIVAFFALIGAGTFVRAGAIPKVNSVLARGDLLSAAVRYAVAAAIAALGFYALFSAQRPEALAKIAYVAIVFAAGAALAQQLAPTRAGRWARTLFVRMKMQMRAVTSAVVFANAAEYAVATLLGALILAMLLPSLAERFATTAYVAALFTIGTVAMNWSRRTIVARDPWTYRTVRQRWQFAALVTALLVIGSAFAFSPAAEGAAVAACLYAIAVAVRRSARTPAPV